MSQFYRAPLALLVFAIVGCAAVPRVMLGGAAGKQTAADTHLTSIVSKAVGSKVMIGGPVNYVAIAGTDQVPPHPSSKPGYSDFDSWISFGNNGNREVTSITVRYVARENATNRVVFTSEPSTCSTFDNRLTHHSGSLMPWDLARKVHVTAELPNSIVSPDTVGSWEITDATEFRVTGEGLNDWGHLYTAFCALKDEDVIALLKADPTLISAKDDVGNTAMMAAAAARGADVLTYMAAHGGAWTEQNTKKCTLMHFAALNENLRVPALLKEHGCDVNARNSYLQTPLFKAVNLGRGSAVVWLLGHGAKPDVVDRNEYTPARYAIDLSRPAILQALSTGGANPHRHDSKGGGWMHYASVSPRMFEEVKKYGLSVEDCDPKLRVTPLMYAEAMTYLQGVPWLLAHGADPKRRDAQGFSAYDYSLLHHGEQELREEVARFAMKS